MRERHQRHRRISEAWALEDSARNHIYIFGADQTKPIIDHFSEREPSAEMVSVSGLPTKMIEPPLECRNVSERLYLHAVFLGELEEYDPRPLVQSFERDFVIPADIPAHDDIAEFVEFDFVVAATRRLDVEGRDDGNISAHMKPAINEAYIADPTEFEYVRRSLCHSPQDFDRAGPLLAQSENALDLAVERRIVEPKLKMQNAAHRIVGALELEPFPHDAIPTESRKQELLERSAFADRHFADRH